MAKDKEFKIHLKTTGDPSGAKEVEKALDNATESFETFTSGGTTSLDKDFRKAEKAADGLADKVDEVADAVKDFSKAPPLPFQPAQVKPVEKSLDGLSQKVERLRRELRAIPVDSDNFKVVAARVKAAELELSNAEAQASKLGATLSRRGNAGLAVLEFSRLIEDSQYGLRGVLNNIPGLITILGGGAGLAGVISLLAVAGTQLWEQFSEGTKKNTEDLESLTDALDEARKFYEQLGNAALNDLRTRGDQDAARIEFLQRMVAMEERIASIRDNVAGLRARREGELSLAEEKLRLAREEAQIALAGGETAKALAKAREESQKRVLALEKEISEEARRREIEPFRRAVATAEQQKATAGADRDRARLDLAEVEREAQELADALNTMQQTRLQQVERMQVELEQARQDLARELETPAGGEVSNIVRRHLNKTIEELSSKIRELSDPFLKREDEFDNRAQRQALQPFLDRARENEAAATERWTKAADALTEAATRLAAAEESADINRTADQRRQEIGSAQEALENAEAKRKEAAQRSREQIEGILTSVLEAIGDAANQPTVQSQAEQVRKLIADGLQASEEGQVSELLRRLVDRISTADRQRAILLQQAIQGLDASANTDRILAGQLRDAITRIENLEAQQGNPNP